MQKWFGPLPAVRGIEFSLAEGEFLTIFGPNGAGKSTLLRLIAGLLRPSAGELRIAGETIGDGDGQWRRNVGMLSHQSFLYAGLTAEENLDFYARLYELGDRRSRVREGLDGVGLWPRRADLVRGFSRGMQQRLALARALLHNPGVVLLDEPYTGLDPHAAAMLGGVLERLRREGRTVLLVTHNLSQGLELADRVAVQAGGRWISDEPRAGIDPARWEALYTQRVASAA